MREQFGEKVTLTGSNIPQSQGVPTKVSKWTTVYDTNGVKLTAAASSIVVFTVNVDPSTIDKLLADVYADASHNWFLYLSMGPIHSLGNQAEIVAPRLLDFSTGANIGGYTRPAISVDYIKNNATTMTFAIKNMDTVSHTYDVGVAVR